MKKEYTGADVDALKEKIKPFLDERRMVHTLGVEKEVAFLGGIYCPEKTEKLRISALLHDITKKDNYDKQLQYCREFGIMNSISSLRAPKILHSKTAAALIGKEFPKFDDEEIVSGVRWHTTGRYGMSLFEAIIYLSDYIEENRTFPDCVNLRYYFYSGIREGRDPMLHLYDTLVLSFDTTIKLLMEENAGIDEDTIGARNYFLEKKQELKEECTQ